MYELPIIVPLFYVFYVLSRMSAGPPTGQTQLGSVPGGLSLSIGDTTAQHQHAPITFSHQDRLELPDDPDDPEDPEDPDVPGVTPTPEPDVPGGAPIPEPDRSAPRELCTCYLRSSEVCNLCSAGYKLFHYMISSRPPPVKSPAPTFRSTGFGSCRVPVPLFDDSATAQTASLDGSSGAEAAPYDNDSAPPVAPAPSTSSQPAAPPANTTTPAPFLVAAASMASTTAHTQTATSAADTTTPAPSEGAATVEATMTPAPFQVAAASTDTTPAASYQVAAPSAPSNNGASLGLNPAGQGDTEEHTPAPPVNFTAYRLPSKTRAPSTGVKRARQTPSFIARRLQKVVVVKQRNPADRSKIRRIAVSIRTRQSLKGRYRSLAMRHDLGRLGLGFRDNGVSIRQRFTNSAGVVRLGSGMTLRDNRLRCRRRTSSVNEIRARQRQRARKEMRANQRLHKYPATTPAINVIPATPPAIPNGGGATGWFPVGWSNFGQGARTDVTTPAHVQLATTPAPPTMTGPTQTITPIGPTQATFMTATPTPPTEFAPTGIAQTIIPPAAPTGFAPTTTAAASPGSNAPTQAGMTLPPPTSTGPAPPATTFTFASTSGPSRTQPQTNVSALRGSGSRGRQSGRLGNRPGNGAAKQQAKTPGAFEATFDIEEVAELTDLKEEHPDVMQKYPWILWRRQRIGPKIATENTWLIDRMYYALLRLAATRSKYVENFDLEKELRILGEANDGTIVARHREESDGENINAIEGVDVSALRGGVFC